ncbi:cytochrome P450 2M1-like isoform X2 [Erpetoichthys calabaricus]|uniref:Cytochrome P450 2M1-like n=1 Tax=Erpetoichthys calabaricus TaxID=27687 RepID=A0A8C4TPX2_ERPCA|nr:cytochrome P450 2M1-like isoform X2 [Erpetoichthys calabaricus]
MLELAVSCLVYTLSDSLVEMELLFLPDTSFSSFVIGLLAFLLLLKIFSQSLKTSRLPPGPAPLPLVGNLLQLDMKKPSMSYLELSKTYGSVFTVWLGSKPAVVLSSYSTLKDALLTQGEEFSGRYIYPVLQKSNEGYGVVGSNGEQWKQVRRFSLTTLKNFGMGRRSIEERIQEETNFLQEAFLEKKDLLFNPKFIVLNAVANVICSVVFGRRFSYQDKDFLFFLKTIDGYFNFLSRPTGQLYNIFPKIMNHLPGEHKKVFADLEKLKMFIRNEATSLKAKMNPDDPNNFIEAFLAQILKEKANPQTEFHELSLENSVMNMFSAGTETVSSTLRQAILIMMKFPHIQEKVQEEIDTVIGSHRTPCMQDKQNMPYTDAVLHEIQRFMDLAPIGIPHTVIKDTEFKGYLLPKDTVVIPLLSSALSDPTMWKTTDSFCPENFLDENGAFKKNDAFLVFSLGKRACLGESLARMEIFLFITSLLQKFTFTSPLPLLELDISPELCSFGRMPRPYQMYVKVRV